MDIKLIKSEVSKIFVQNFLFKYLFHFLMLLAFLILSTVIFVKAENISNIYSDNLSNTANLADLTNLVDNNVQAGKIEDFFVLPPKEYIYESSPKIETEKSKPKNKLKSKLKHVSVARFCYQIFDNLGFPVQSKNLDVESPELFHEHDSVQTTKIEKN